ncbi:MAG: hypothetical protein CMO55_02955 [Verrucomicrobiales bacterium]|nr:hypothetical protein [Verrucomicrobiales bacterium]
MEKFKAFTLEVFEVMPIYAQIFVGAIIFAFAAASVYSRINLNFGAKTFSGIPREQLRTNVGHILVYTGIPVVLAIAFFTMVAIYYTSGK